MLSYEDNVRAILEGNLPEVKDEVLDTIVKNILNLKDDSKTGAPSFGDPDYINSSRICGYTVKELILVAEILKEKQIDEVKLDNYAAGLQDGYLIVQNILEKSLQNTVNSIKKTFNGLD